MQALSEGLTHHRLQLPPPDRCELDGNVAEGDPEEIILIRNFSEQWSR
jgi:hypothetical protein